jgi:hypothetical protein
MGSQETGEAGFGRRNGEFGTWGTRKQRAEGLSSEREIWNEEAEPRDPAFVPCLAAPGYFQAHAARALSSPTPRAAFTEEQTPARRPEIVQTSAQSHPTKPPICPPSPSLLIPFPSTLNPFPSLLPLDFPTKTGGSDKPKRPCWKL